MRNNKPRYRTHKPDDNHYSIIRGLERAGLLVEDIHNGSLADILIARGDRVFIFEIKMPGKRNDLTKKQKEKRLLWRNNIYIVETVEEIFKIVGMK